ncbi:MAG TPA: response regulator transcription factor [Symbiobacteriaceae bacterium]|nr:response regulator transcription factor [Symbiobacteriaceae bacterium]
MIPVILVVDDDASIVELVRYNLLRAGYRVLTAADGHEAQMTLANTPVDLVVLDLMLPGLSGFDLCRWFRRHSRAPVMILTARYEEADRIRALEAGADDYITKPFSPTELTARVRAHLRRWSWQSAGGDGQADTITLGPLTLDLAGRRAFHRGAELHLTPMEFEILRVLSRSAGRCIPRERLLALASGQEVVGSARTVDVHVRSLRLKMEDDPAHPTFLETVRGCGYCLGRLHVPDQQRRFPFEQISASGPGH